jgi:hypothetical protein
MGSAGTLTPSPVFPFMRPKSTVIPELTSAGQCRAEAEACERLATQAKDEEARRMFNEAAERWRQMAAIVERNTW